MTAEKTIYISQKLYNTYCEKFAHYYDPIEIVPKFKDIIKFFSQQGDEGEQVARLAVTHRLRIFPE